MGICAITCGGGLGMRAALKSTVSIFSPTCPAKADSPTPPLDTSASEYQQNPFVRRASNASRRRTAASPTRCDSPGANIGTTAASAATGSALPLLPSFLLSFLPSFLSSFFPSFMSFCDDDGSGASAVLRVQ